MIDNSSFSKEWIDSFRTRKGHKSIILPILEKMIHALSLLEHLKIAGLNFVFKGGTSLVLLMKDGNRFSIDIDIVAKIEQESLETILEEVVKKSHFNKVKLNKERSYKEGIPKAHYTFEFDSVYNTKVRGTILLDILFDRSHYPELIETPISTPWINIVDIPTIIITPSINSIIGDKLTAFAPDTIGIPYYKSNQSFSKEICKQLFDLGQLFEQITDMSTVRKSYTAFIKAELDYRKSDDCFKARNISEEDVLWDTINTCIILAKRKRNDSLESRKRFDDLCSGMHKFSDFLMRGHFRIEQALATSARVAYLCAILIGKNPKEIEHFKGQDMSSMTLTNVEWAFVNRLKKQPDKSIFFYWFKAIELLDPGSIN